MENLLSSATIGETATIAKDVNAAVTKATIDDNYLNEQNVQLKSNADSMITGIGTDKGKELSPEIESADTKRDNLLAALIHFLKGFILWTDETEKNAAAEKLMQIVKSHGNNFSRLSNEKESAQYDSLMEEFEKPQAVAAFATIGFPTLAAAMQNAETNFINLYQQSAELESGKTTITPSVIKRSTQDQLNEIVDYLISMQKANAPVYGALAANVAELIDTLNRKIRIRNSSVKNTVVADTGTN